MELGHNPSSLPKIKMCFDEASFDYLRLVLAYIGLTLWTGNLLMFTISLIYCKFYLHRVTNDADGLGVIHGVSIIKPMMGLDPYLQANLESHFLLKYPKFQLLLCVHDEKDPAVTVVNHLLEKYPNVDAQLISGDCKDVVNPIVNPMVANMAPAFQKVKYNLIWISTSRIKAKTEILFDMVDKIQSPKVAIVHQVPYYMDQLGMAGYVDKIYFGTVLPRNYVPFNVLGLCCVTGMSYLIKKPVLDEIGGMKAFGNYLAEDFFMTKALSSKGYQFKLAAIPAQQNVITPTIGSFTDRMVRWNRLRLNMLPLPSVFLEPFIYCFPMGLYAACCFHYLLNWNPYVYFVVHVCVWIVLDYCQLYTMQNGGVTMSNFEFVCAWFFTNLLLLWIYIRALCNPCKIVWGSRTFRVTWGGHTQLIRDESNFES